MNLAPLPIQKFFNNNGRPLDGGKLFTYVSGTTTKIATYTDASGGASNANPIILDFRGECRLWIDPTKAYTFVLAPSTDTDPPTNPFWTVNDITAAPFAFDNAAVDTGSVNNIALAIPQISSPVAFTRIVFKAANTNTGAVSISINGGTAKALTWQNVGALAGGSILAGGIYQAVFDGAQWQLQSAMPYPRTAAEVTAGVTPTDYSVPSHDKIGEVLAARYGADNAGVTAADTALANAVLVSASANQATIKFDHGQYRFTGTTTIGYGIMIEGPGSQGSTEPYGTVFMHEGAGNFLLWDGNGADFRGTGGGLKNVLILKKTGTSGGDAIKLLATSDNRRPGEMFFENVLIYGQGSGVWARGLHIDGTAANTPGSKGVRSVVLNKFRVADCSTALQYINLNQAVHFTGTHVQIDQGSNGNASIGVSITGDSDNVSFLGAVINGELEVNGSSAINLDFVGHVSTLDINNTSVDGVAILSGNSVLTNASLAFRVMSPTADAFAALLSASTSNDKTGDGTDYDIICDSELFDRNSSYDNTTGVFTAKCSGLYEFNATWTYANLGVAHVTSTSGMVHRNAASATIRAYKPNGGNNPYAMAAGGAGGDCTRTMAIIVQMSEGEKMALVADVAGGAKTVGIKGNNTGTVQTFFSGKLLA